MAVRAPGPAVDPHFSQLESVSIRLSLTFECHPPPSEYRNFFSAPVFLDDDHRARKPRAGLCLLRFQLDSVSTVIFSAHSRTFQGLSGMIAHCAAQTVGILPHQMLDLPPLSLMPSLANASTTGMSAPSVLPTS